ncbi:nucleoside phosphorylase [Aureibaculum sp. 2210JD6-5]|uniref:nucleoside phosphorylase n=1 Tax=Aureibaculum sp. 2210JD6-5 TaxID=3103957 RepID=UPI002AAD42F1|nr:nucleoside phosphorylase [Aureibaculum sp. 2210JD6-5]MDY7396580.1 nucleoside phosphorylase [Aureibaculum sp. 2210JD6-5]
MQPILPSELILNKDGSIYHLNLKPENIADTIIFVGDQDRVATVAKHFDNILFQTQKREFKTVTGIYKGKKLSVISTGIGPDNIDIVLNELDALVNINLDTKTVKLEHTELSIVRIGTSGSLQNNIPVNSFVLSSYGLGMDGTLRAYDCERILEKEIEDAFIKHTDWSIKKARPYAVKASSILEQKISDSEIFKGITATANGFYGPQGRVLRLALQDPVLNSKIDSFNYKGEKITNLEMETSAIYGLAKLLGHEALSMNAIIANRASGTFSENPQQVIEKLITYTLNKLVKS